MTRATHSPRSSSAPKSEVLGHRIDGPLLRGTGSRPTDPGHPRPRPRRAKGRIVTDLGGRTWSNRSGRSGIVQVFLGMFNKRVFMVSSFILPFSWFGMSFRHSVRGRSLRKPRVGGYINIQYTHIYTDLHCRCLYFCKFPNAHSSTYSSLSDYWRKPIEEQASRGCCYT